MYVKTKQEILDYLAAKAKAFQMDQVDSSTAIEISKTLNISRSLASQYLNELVKESKLIKINSRPVYFLHKKGIEVQVEKEIRQSEFSGLQELQEYLHNGKQDYETAIGYRLGLYECIERCKAAMRYPTDGLPVLIAGESGTGKSYLAGLTFAYCKERDLILKNGKMIVINCAQYADSQEEFLKFLFGMARKQEKNVIIVKEGALDEADNGLLLLEDVNCLNVKCQEKILAFMESGKFFREGSTEVWKCSKVKIIFTTSVEPEKALIKKLLRRVPVIINIPALDERTSEEKEEMIITFFQNESRRMGHPIAISGRVLQTMMNFRYTENVGMLKSYVSIACARAFQYYEGSGVLEVHIFHLPQEMLSLIKLEEINGGDEDTKMIDLNHYVKNSTAIQNIKFYEQILKNYLDFCQKKLDFETFLENEFHVIKEYQDYLVYGKKYNKNQLQIIEQLMESITTLYEKKYGMKIPVGCYMILVQVIYIQIQSETILEDWCAQNRNELDTFLSELERRMNKEYTIVETFSEMVMNKIDLELPDINKVLFTLVLRYYNWDYKAQKICGIIICHGISTASSIADTANRLVGGYLFDAIDMPLDADNSQMLTALRKSVQDKFIAQEIIVLVDMGSLEKLGENLKDFTGLNIGIINNVSTGLAVEIGFKMKQMMSMKEILQGSAEKNINRYQLVENQMKEKAIIFTSESGEDAAVKIKKLFVNSIPKEIPVKIIYYDYYQLLRFGMKDEIFLKYEVIFITGIFNPMTSEIPFIALGDIINFKAISQIDRLFSKYLTSEEIGNFNASLLKNFTLLNVVQNVTILNPDKLLDQIEKAMDKLQHSMKKTLKPKTLVGLYVHLCCFIERMVTKTPVTAHKNIEAFEREQQDFISKVMECFTGVMQHYMLTFPISEIIYIYEYIKHDDDVDDNPDDFE